MPLDHSHRGTMKNSSLDAGFEEYRRGRQKRRLESGQAFRPMGENAEVLAQIERAEAAEVLDQRLTREVHDFFSDATKTAAAIVQKVSAEAEAECGERISSEMEQFLVETMKRMEHLVHSLKAKVKPGLAEAHFEADMHKLVGPALDAFRDAGTAQLQDKHIGQDPFAAEIEGMVTQPCEYPTDEEPPESEDPWAAITAPASAPDDAIDELEEVLADRLEPTEPSQAVPAPRPAPQQPKAAPVAEVAPARDGEAERADHFLLAGLGDDPERMREALKVLVRNQLMSKDEALRVYRQAMNRRTQPR